MELKPKRPLSEKQIAHIERMRAAARAKGLNNGTTEKEKAVSVKQNSLSLRQKINNECDKIMLEMQDKPASEKLAILSDLPRIAHERMAKDASNDFGAEDKGQLSQLFEDVVRERQTKEGKLSGLPKSEHGEASPGLHEAKRSDMAVPRMSSETSQKSASGGDKVDMNTMIALIQEIQKSNKGISPEELVKAMQTAVAPDRQMTEQSFEFDNIQIAEEDYLDDPINFIFRSSGHSIFSARINGRVVNPPLGRPIKFEKYVTFMFGIGRNAQQQHISRFVCRSKKEADYVRMLPGYGLNIEEQRSSDLGMVDLESVNKMQEAINYISNIRTDNLRATCQAKGIEFAKGETMENLRKKLIRHTMNELAKQEKNISQNISRTAADVLKEFGTPAQSSGARVFTPANANVY